MELSYYKLPHSLWALATCAYVGGAHLDINADLEESFLTRCRGSSGVRNSLENRANSQLTVKFSRGAAPRTPCMKTRVSLYHIKVLHLFANRLRARLADREGLSADRKGLWARWGAVAKGFRLRTDSLILMQLRLLESSSA